MAGENSLEGDWEIYVDFRLFLLDQKKGKYLVIEDAFTKENCFHREMLRSPGFDKLMALEEFTDDSNGYVVDDTCVFGAEVFVCKERTKGRRERLLRIHNATYKQVWKVNNFSKLNAPYYESEPFNAGNQKWKVMLYPKGNDSGVEFSLSIIGQKHANHITGRDKHCFSATSTSWGWPQLIRLSTFSEADKGFLMKNTCILEAEVTVHGIAKRNEEGMLIFGVLLSFNKGFACIYNQEPETSIQRVLRSYSGSPPSHYNLKVNSFSFMTENTVDGYETEEFEAGGHKWKLVIYPNGNKRKNVVGHISLYLEMAGENSLQGDWEIYVDFRLFYLIRKRASTWLLKMLSQGKIAFMGRCCAPQVWKVEKLFKVDAPFYESEPFNAGNQKWQIMLYPTGNLNGVGTHLSLYLVLSDLKPTPPVSKVFAEFSLRIVDQKHANHLSWTAKHWFRATAMSLGWPKFICLSTFSMVDKGF
ncbi:hypothetical protein M0R45_021242 [Rubus argutus]|uniref:MATH domain-containing protein n=1 Tax=Rubus argutus TaxID=59490 RepID=A0AAW1XB79_RUBAR